MSYLTAAPELLTSAATDLAAIGSNVDAAHLMAAARTTAVIPAAADEVSAAIAQVFSQHAAGYQAAAGQAAAFGQQFAANLAGSAAAYFSSDSALAGFLQALMNADLALGSIVFTPLEQTIEAQGPLSKFAVVALFALLFPYTFNVLVLYTITDMLVGEPI